MEIRRGEGYRTRTSTSYMFSLNPNSGTDAMLLKELRQSVKEYNRNLKENSNPDGTRYFKRVTVKYRDAKVKTGRNAYTYHGDLIGGKDNSNRWDIYVQDRRMYDDNYRLIRN